MVFGRIRQISGNGLLNITSGTAQTMSMTTPSKSSSSCYTRNSDPTSSSLNERETRFASGIQRDRSAVPSRLACSRLSVVGDERKREGWRLKKRGKTKAGTAFLALVLPRCFSHSPFFGSSPTSESLEQAMSRSIRHQEIFEPQPGNLG